MSSLAVEAQIPRHLILAGQSPGNHSISQKRWALADDRDEIRHYRSLALPSSSLARRYCKSSNNWTGAGTLGLPLRVRSGTFLLFRGVFELLSKRGNFAASANYSNSYAIQSWNTQMRPLPNSQFAPDWPNLSNLRLTYKPISGDCVFGVLCSCVFGCSAIASI